MCIFRWYTLRALKDIKQRKNDEISNCFSAGKILIMSFDKITAWKVNLRIEKPARSVIFCLCVRIVSSSIGSFYIKRLFIWRWGTPGRWGNPLRWGKAITPLYMHSYNPAMPGALSQDYWMVAKHVNKKNAGKPCVLAINAPLHSLTSLPLMYHSWEKPVTVVIKQIRPVSLTPAL